MTIIKTAQFNIGQAVRHRAFDYGGVIVDADPVFAESEEWFAAIPAEYRPERDQPFYRVRVDYEGVDSIAYVSEQNLVADPVALDMPAAEILGQLGAGDPCAALH